MSVMLIGIQCQLDSPSPSVFVLHQMVQFLQSAVYINVCVNEWIFKLFLDHLRKDSHLEY